MSPPRQCLRIPLHEGQWISNLNSPLPQTMPFSQLLGIRTLASLGWGRQYSALSKDVSGNHVLHALVKPECLLWLEESFTFTCLCCSHFLCFRCLSELHFPSILCIFLTSPRNCYSLQSLFWVPQAEPKLLSSPTTLLISPFQVGTLSGILVYVF